MRTEIHILLVAGVAAAALAAASSGASARIVCKGPYQIVEGQSLATPYCEDGYLAVVAREYGVRVTAAVVRSNPARKAEVCRLVGFDNRARNACTGYDDPFHKKKF